MQTPTAAHPGKKGIARIIQYFVYWWRVRTVTSAAHKFSRTHFPEDRLLCCLLAEDHLDECVVYAAYKYESLSGDAFSHRFFRIRLPDLSVTTLSRDYHPERWGPCF